MGDVLLQLGSEAGLDPPPTHAAVVHQQEGLVVVVKGTRVLECALGRVLSRRTTLETVRGQEERTSIENSRNQ